MNCKFGETFLFVCHQNQLKQFDLVNNCYVYPFSWQLNVSLIIIFYCPNWCQPELLRWIVIASKQDWICFIWNVSQSCFGLFVKLLNQKKKEDVAKLGTSNPYTNKSTHKHDFYFAIAIIYTRYWYHHTINPCYIDIWNNIFILTNVW